MIRHERLDKIEQYIQEHKYASIQELMEEFHISRATVRRDLSLLSEKEGLEITHGGAMAREDSTRYEPTYHEKTITNEGEKKRIAKRASMLAEHSGTIILDSGTTIYNMPDYFKNKEGVVATCDLMVAMKLSECSNIDVVVIGGGSLRKGFYTILGKYTEQMISEFHFDKAFIACDAINVSSGIMITNHEEVALKQAIIRASKEVILLCDHSKFEKMAFATFSGIEEITKIITGRELNSGIRKQLEELDIQLELV